MSFLVQGIDVPKNCGIGGRDGLGCPCFCHYNRRCQVSNKVIETAYYRDHDRPSDCPVFPIPPHGRLVDTDAVNLEGGPYEYDEWCKWALERYQDAPTIIPAEGK